MIRFSARVRTWESMAMQQGIHTLDDSGKNIGRSGKKRSSSRALILPNDDDSALDNIRSIVRKRSSVEAESSKDVGKPVLKKRRLKKQSFSGPSVIGKTEGRLSIESTNSENETPLILRKGKRTNLSLIDVANVSEASPSKDLEDLTSIPEMPYREEDSSATLSKVMIIDNVSEVPFQDTFIDANITKPMLSVWSLSLSPKLILLEGKRHVQEDSHKADAGDEGLRADDPAVKWMQSFVPLTVNYTRSFSLSDEANLLDNPHVMSTFSNNFIGQNKHAILKDMPSYQMNMIALGFMI
ncbi:uncharacterized protein LOC132642610 isoform X1 [Lycium barbarum]|uniref:uncharacterized protein LOC132642610 isoform X1 n=1 Tax=Lycium barbarum TaxID=112863 RepID=UPI00293F51B9|nr:uncharacterized protein LOC132642610 isoform X1 [Lycium barbarum]